MDLSTYPTQLEELFNRYCQIENDKDAYYYLRDFIQKMVDEGVMTIKKTPDSHDVYYVCRRVSHVSKGSLQRMGSWELDGCEELYLRPEQYPDCPDHELITFWFRDCYGEHYKFAIRQPAPSFISRL